MEHGPTTWMVSLPFLSHDPHYVHVNAAILVFIGIVLFSIAANVALRRRRAAQVVPDGKVSFLNVVDAMMEGIHGFITDTIGKHGEPYVPFIGSLFIFILFSNFLGLIPYSSAPTSNVNTTFALGIAAFVYYNILGVKEQGVVGYLKHFLMGLGPAGVIVALLEIVSQLVRPLSLGIRLFVNMHVDHEVVLSFQNLFAWLLPVPLLMFGIVVSVIQAFVFAVLTAVYVQMATEHDH
jgi:F-type H+-transporting ATPase subunit a